MPTIPSHLRQLLSQAHVVWVATTGQDGMPNVSVKTSGTLVDDEHLYFADMYARKTYANLRADPRVAVGVYDDERRVAVQLKGRVELIEDGTLFSRVVQRLKDLTQQLPPPRYVVKVTVESIWDMSTGPHAGDAYGDGTRS